MSPAVTPVSPTRSAIEDWDTTDLDERSVRWRQAALGAETAFEQHRQNVMAPGGTAWEGDAKDAALDRVTADMAVACHHSDVQREAADIAARGSEDIRDARSRVLDAIAEAEGDGFAVGENLSVTDTRSYSAETATARITAAIEHAEYIHWRAEQLAATDALVGQQLQEKAVELEGIQFEGEGSAGDGAVQLVDNETESPEPGEGDGDGGSEDADTESGGEDGTEAPADEGPYSPHPDYPNRNKNGTYGDGNTADGKEAEQKALDLREEETGAPLIRDQVRATHPDVQNPQTGKPQGRYYDALEPTGNPDEYIGVEAKTHEGVDLTADQARFDEAVSAERPATAVVDGREVKIVDTVVVHPPEGWDAPSAEPVPGGAESGATGPAVPPALAGDPGKLPAGAAPAPPAPTAGSPLPDWGTQLTPQEMIDSGDPALRVAGEEIRRRMAEQGIVDTSGIA